MNQNQLELIMEEIKKQSKEHAYSIEINHDRAAGILDSKFGGVPYWDMTMEYPKDAYDDKLLFLAQINLEQNELGELLPKKGMLQFFIGTDDMCGMDFENQDEQNGFRVVHHETINHNITKEEVLALGIPHSTSEEPEEFSPLEAEYAIDLSKTQVSVGVGDEQYDQAFFVAAKRLNIELNEDDTVEDIFCDVYGEDEYYDMLDGLQNDGHWLLGYPYFTQNDPREEEKRYRRYDTLLFQMDSDSDDENDFITWGDAGVANFFINKEDLKKGDFSKILYNWDCC